MSENFLHYIWLHRLYKSPIYELYTNEVVEILNPGEYNKNSGTDFQNARIKIGNTIWAGNIEIHVNASDWYIHEHQLNSNYNNIILHVVLNNDKHVTRSDGSLIPAIQLPFYQSIYQNYLNLKKPKSIIKCTSYINKIEPFYLNHWIEQLAFERISTKADIIDKILSNNNFNWEETFYQVLIKSFGFNLNANQFENLAKSLPNKILGKHKNNLLQIEAMLYGQAGFLPEKSSEGYVLSLKREYQLLQTKFNLKPINNQLWKFLRLRPDNFPTIRIAQIAQLIFRSNNLFSKIIEAKSIDEIKKHFDIKTSDYWTKHYTFGKPSAYREKSLGQTAFQSILINAIIPMQFIYGRKKNNENLSNRALLYLEKIPAERNSIIKKWGNLQITSDSAFQSQALIQLYNSYCKKSECLRCLIGHRVLTMQ